MEKFIISFRHIPSAAQQTDSHGTRRFNCTPVFKCALLTVVLLSGIGVAQAQQPDPLTVTPQGNVGIGTTTPANKLSVAGNADVSGNVGIGTATPANKLSVTGNSNFSGNVGIGTTAPSAKLDVAGSGWFRNDQNALPATAGKGVRVFYDVLDAGQIFSYDYSTSKPSNLLLQSPGGNVGIGTTNPQFGKLQVAGGATPALRLDANSGVAAMSIGGTGELLVDAVGVTGGRLIVKDNGNVGIGTNNPTKAKLEVSGFVNRNQHMYGFLRNPYSADDVEGKKDVVGKYHVHPQEAPGLPYSIWADRRVAAEEFNAFSDERLKNILGHSDSAKDLRTLLSIEITDYRHKDVIGKGNGTYKKVTGQQVARVFPQAVSKATEVVPDIYQQASIQDGWVTLVTDLKKGERVKLITAQGEGIYEVLEVAPNRFRTDFKPEGNRVFVYGREVKDFLTVDYEAISMLNVSATQQIKKEKDEEVKALQEENAALRSQLAEQEKRLAAIESLLLAGDKHARATSLKKVE